MWSRMVNPAMTPMHSLLFPSLKPEEIDHKIKDMKAVEAWLTANLGMLQLTIKTLEYQRTLLTTPPEQATKAGAAKPQDAPGPTPAWPWNTSTLNSKPAPPAKAPAGKGERNKKGG